MAEQERWREVAARQQGLITRPQLREDGVNRWAVAHRLASERWQALPSARVLATTTGPLSPAQERWLGVLHAGPGALLGALTAAEEAGLRNWHRDDITVLTPYEAGRPPPLHGFAFVRTRRSLLDLRAKGSAPPRCRIEPAVLLFAATEPHPRTAQGALAAAV